MAPRRGRDAVAEGDVAEEEHAERGEGEERVAGEPLGAVAVAGDVHADDEEREGDEQHPDGAGELDDLRAVEVAERVAGDG
ncbi:MAG: hypothetical protein R3F65_11045 [bacterium]